jgi:hypothetical protein
MHNTTVANPRVHTYYDLADCADDGGKHALYCEHADGSTSVLQDTNKRRLMEWLAAPEQWCGYCCDEAEAVR